MEHFLTTFLTSFILLVLVFTAQVGSAPSPIITTKTGQVRGQTVQFTPSSTESAIELYKFTAIPFATPPVGPLRFKKTQPLQSWTGVLDATRTPNACSQNPMPMSGSSDTIGVEDCLHLNIWVTKNKLDAFAYNRPNKQPLSVYVFIHGGGFASGSTKDTMFDGMYMAGLNEIIVVTIQYRLGSLGFGYLGNNEVPGNMGLWDQLEALKWISENIGSFGGNNQQITIGGESAGAVSTSWHLLSPNSRKYFQKAIIQSGTAISPWGRNSAQVALAVTNMVFQQICNESIAGKMQCLRAADSKKFPPADKLPSSRIYEHILHPVPAGDFLPGDPVTMLRSGDFYKVPLLIGANKDEGSMFVSMTDLANKILPSMSNPTASIDSLTLNDYNALMADRNKQLYGEIQYPVTPNQLLIDAVRLQYWPRSHEGNPKGAEVFKAVSDAHGEMGMTCPSYVWANVTAQSIPNNVFVYYLTQRLANTMTPDFMGVAHGDDLGFTFGRPFAPQSSTPGPFNAIYTEQEKQLSRNIMTYWANFIKYGNPNGNGNRQLTNWPAFVGRSCSEQYFELNTETQGIIGNRQAVICGLKKSNCLFWQEYMPPLEAKLLSSNVTNSRPNNNNFSNPGPFRGRFPGDRSRGDDFRRGGGRGGARNRNNGTGKANVKP